MVFDEVLRNAKRGMFDVKEEKVRYGKESQTRLQNKAHKSTCSEIQCLATWRPRREVLLVGVVESGVRGVECGVHVVPSVQVASDVEHHEMRCSFSFSIYSCWKALVLQEVLVDRLTNGQLSMRNGIGTHSTSGGYDH